MLYIERDKDGNISAIRHNPSDKANEQKTLLDEEIIDFLGRDGTLDSLIRLLSISDLSMIRIIEDLIDVLVKKNIIMLTDLPEEAKQKIIERKKVRSRMDNNNLIVDDIL